MATLDVTQLTATATDPGFTAAALAGDQFLIDAEAVLLVRNTGAATRTITLTSQAEASPGITEADLEFEVAAGEEAALYLGDRYALFKDTDGYCQIAYDAVTSLAVAVVRT